MFYLDVSAKASSLGCLHHLYQLDVLWHTLYFLRKNLHHFLSVLVTLDFLRNFSLFIGNSHLCLCT